MGGSLDAFKLYLDLFKVREEPEAAKNSTFWGAVDRQDREERDAEAAKAKKQAEVQVMSDSGNNAEGSEEATGKK
jgi:hypothetical protein